MKELVDVVEDFRAKKFDKNSLIKGNLGEED
jgi:hypothetical protein